MSEAFGVLAVAYPAEPIRDLPVPRRILLPIHFLDILYGVECEVDAQGHLTALVELFIRIASSTSAVVKLLGAT